MTNEPLEIQPGELGRGRTHLTGAPPSPPKPIPEVKGLGLPSKPPSGLEFTPAEQEIVNLINEAHQKILDLDLRCNKSELAGHVHGMQMFVLKHSLQRLGFKGLSRWFWRDL